MGWETDMLIRRGEIAREYAKEQEEGEKIKELLRSYASGISDLDNSVIVTGAAIQNNINKYLNKCFVGIYPDRSQSLQYRGTLKAKGVFSYTYHFKDTYDFVDHLEEKVYPDIKYIIVPCRKELEAETKKIPGNSPLTDKIRTVLDNMLKEKRQLDEDNEIIKDMVKQKLKAGVSKSEVNSILRSLPLQNQNNIRRSNGYTSLKDPVNTKFSIQGGKRKTHKTRKHKNRKSKTRKH